MNKSELAINYFRNNFNCSQSVLTAFGQDFGLSEDNCLRIACAFGGGMGRQQHTCGAVTGALMVLGLKYGKAKNDADEKKSESYLKAVELFNELKLKHKSTNCKELLQDLDMNNEADFNKIKDLILNVKDIL